MNSNTMSNPYQNWIPPTYSAPPPSSSSTPSARSRTTGNQAMPRPALPSAISHLQQQAQQSNRLAAAAAASMSSLLNTHIQPQVQDRTILNYTDITPPNPFHCAECDKSYNREQQFRSHMKSHVQCSECAFSASVKVIEAHKESVHGTVNVNKKPPRTDGVVPPNAPKIDTPEDLKKWIEERKRNWPSRQNIERKKKDIEERIARGELLPENKPFNKRKGKHEESANKRSRQSNNPDTPPSMNSDPAAALIPKDTHPFSSLADYGSDSDNQNSDDDMMDPEKDAISSKDPSAVGVIALPADNVPKKKKTRVCRFFQKGNCNRGDSCSFLHEMRPKTPRNATPQQPVEIFRTRSGLLEKLLEKDIKAEKSMILQCLRYIVQNDFFGAGAASE